MAVSTVTITLRLAWRLRLYLSTLMLLCHLTGMEPNMARATFWIQKGIKIDSRPAKASA